MHRSFECSTTPSSVGKMHLTGQTAAQGASVQCMHAIETDRSPGLPSLMVTTRRRLMPHGTSFSFLQAVTQALQSMQRSASQRNFIRAMDASLRRSDLAEGGFGFLHARRRIVAVGGERVHALAEHDRIGALRVFGALVDALEPPGEVERHPRHALADTLCHQGLHPRLRSLSAPVTHTQPLLAMPRSVASTGLISTYHVLFQFGQPLVRARLLAAALVFDEAAGAQDQREVLARCPYRRPPSAP